MQAARSSIKRARSPAVPSSSSSMTSYDDPFVDPVGGVEEVTKEESSSEHLRVPMPGFLLLRKEVIANKFARLQQLESSRLSAAREDTSMTFKWARFDFDSTHDRYSNVRPWANFRVKLKVLPPFDDYINATPVSLPRTLHLDQPNEGHTTRFIAMQGPKRETVHAVWHMIWHESPPTEPAVILMLTPTHVPLSPGKQIEKCYPYYPIDETSSHIYINHGETVLPEDFKGMVRFVSKTIIPGTTIELRELSMSVEGAEADKTIYHFLWPDWPDYEAVALGELDSITRLMVESRAKNPRPTNSRFIHCSAGIGRTGTFVALEHLMSELEDGIWEGWHEGEKKEWDPVFENVNRLRMLRNGMVQTSEQYALIYEGLRRMWEDRYAIHEPEEATVVWSADGAAVKLDGEEGHKDGKEGTKQDEDPATEQIEQQGKERAEQPDRGKAKERGEPLAKVPRV